MEIEALQHPAKLMVWKVSDSEPHAPEGWQFAALEEAIATAAHFLIEPEQHPWIVTADGELLSPTWIRTYLH